MRFKKLEYKKGGMKAFADSGHKEFDRHVDYIGTGNVYSTVQSSSFIRPRAETECNARSFPEGHLRDFDVKPFQRTGLPAPVYRKLMALTDRESAILYRFSHPTTRGKRVVHGWVITRAGTHELLYRLTTGPTGKSDQVLGWCIQYITPSAAPEPVHISELSTVKMVSGGEDRTPVVIHDGIRKRWVGMGWVDEGRATEADKKLYPTVIP